MAILKVSIFQKNLAEGLNLSLHKRLSAVKSDFLVFPEYFAVDGSTKDHRALADRTKFALDWLGKLSESYKGVVIGGTVIREIEGKFYNAMPVFFEGQLIDWYHKRFLTENEAPLLTPGKDPGVFILGGHRFGVLICADVLKPEYVKELADMDVKLIFTVMNSPYKEETVEEKHERDEKLYCGPAREMGLSIIKCCSAGTIFGRRLQGRSLAVTPSGISWRVAPEEEDREILKTVVLNA
ncbi:MAG: carbon-nitrogen hydrolase family protein [Leptospiraceae bacterium]|nr:carbon-nitrogen hydrolase family protein [Leptospiraceae bacterium]MCB1303186.1 carbon-nitrogen hydrolase family protein [Leptospiraceae bacterium]